MSNFLTNFIDVTQLEAKIKNFTKIIQLKGFNAKLQEEVQKAIAELVEREHEALQVILDWLNIGTQKLEVVFLVAHYLRLLVKEYGLNKEGQDIIFFASPLHDIGKDSKASSIKIQIKEIYLQFEK